jgi:hypothetical protein
MNSYFPIKYGKVRKARIGIGLEMLLVMDKFSYEISKVGLSDFGSNIVRVSFIYCK